MYCCWLDKINCGAERCFFGFAVEIDFVCQLAGIDDLQATGNTLGDVAGQFEELGKSLIFAAAEGQRKSSWVGRYVKVFSKINYKKKI